MIIIKNRGNKINITHRPVTYKINVGGRRGPTGPQGPQGVPGDPASNIVTSVNTQIGDVVLDADDVGADPEGSAVQALAAANDYTDDSIAAIDYPVDSVNGRTGIVTGLAEDNAVLHLTGTETINGVKTFSLSPIVPTPTTNNQAANKIYVDNAISGIPGDAVTSVNGQTGDVVLDADDISDTSTTHKFVTSSDITKLGNLSGTNTGDQIALTVPNTPAGNISATNVQAALNELDNEKANTSVLGSYVLKAGDTMSGTLNGQSIIPTATATYTLGSTSNYYNNAYLRQINLSSTIQLDGFTDVNYLAVTGGGLFQSAASGTILRFTSANSFSSGLRVQKRGLTGDVNGAVASGAEVGYHQFEAWTGTTYKRLAYVIVRSSAAITDSTGGGRYDISTRDDNNTENIKISIDINGLYPGINNTFSLGTTNRNWTNVFSQIVTIPSGGTGFMMYNTADQVTNTERVLGAWSSNIWTLSSQSTGTGTQRAMRFMVGASQINLSNAGTEIRRDTTAVSELMRITSTGLTASSSAQRPLLIDPTYVQTGTASATDILVNRTETSVGSGEQNLVDLQVGSSSRFRVNNLGQIIERTTTNTALILSSSAAGDTAINVINTSTASTNNRGKIQFYSNNAAGTQLMQAHIQARFSTLTAGAEQTQIAFIGYKNGVNTTLFNLDNGVIFLQDNIQMLDGGNMVLGTTTGSKIGTATTQKLALWNKTPIVQPTTAIAGATRVGGAGTTLTDTDTFDGYTIAKVVRALVNIGILA